MYDRMQTLTPEAIDVIHNATMAVLSGTGAAFNEPDAIALFKSRGFRVDGRIVRFNEQQVQDALATVPSRFELKARNPEKNVWVGEDDWVFVPTYGAPFMVGPDGARRPGSMQDYDCICKLVQTSAHIDVNGFKHVEPQDVPSHSAYLDMLLSNILLSDKPFMGSTDTRQAARDTMEMAAMMVGGKDNLKDNPVTVNLINSLSPLQYASEMAGAILELARYRQPLLIANMIMGGTSGPVTLPELLVQMNAEILAGIVLAQLAGPGTPVIYGSTSCPTNMHTGAAIVGTPETTVISSMATQLARHYNIPCRTGGSLTDAGLPDAQALAEGALTLSTAVRNGANFILHSCGMIGGYIGNSLEKWLIDEELCGMVRRMMMPLDIRVNSVDTGIIDRAGIGGNYLMQPETLKHCRSAFFPYTLYTKEDRTGQSPQGLTSVAENASEKLIQRMSSYEKPDINPILETDLATFVSNRKQEKHPQKWVDTPEFGQPTADTIPGALWVPESGYISDPKLSTHNLMVAAQAKGGEFLFKAQVADILKKDGRVAGVKLADGSEIEAPVVVNVAGPHSYIINRLAGVAESMNIKTRPMKQEVAHVPAPEGLNWERDGYMLSDGDIGCYSRPEVGNNFLIGSEDPECDPRLWVDDPDNYDLNFTDQYKCMVMREAMRVSDLAVPNQYQGVVDLYDCSDDWIPIYDKSDLPGFYMAVGTSGNQYKNAPVVGAMMTELIDTCEKGRNHDTDPVQFYLQYTRRNLNVAFYSRNREINTDSSFSVIG